MKRILPFVLVLLALTACTTLQTRTATDPAATELPQVGLPNPASVNCRQQGNKLEIRTAADGSQSGICIFPDGSTCDEWSYYRGECGPAAEKSSTPAVTVEAATEASEEDMGGDNPGSTMLPGASEEVTDWWGVIKGTEPGAQYDDYFERQDQGQVISFGIASMNPEVQAQIKELRDSGKIVHLYGILLSDLPDYNGSQIQVDRMEVK
jgi:uncharacterized protein